MKKEQISIQIPKDTLKKIECISTLNDTLKSRNSAIEKAVDYYFGFLTANKSQDFLLTAYGQAMESAIKSSSDRLAKVLYKSSVETNVLTRVVAVALDVDRSQYDKMRKTAVEDTRFSNGIINLGEV